MDSKVAIVLPVAETNNLRYQRIIVLAGFLHQSDDNFTYFISSASDAFYMAFRFYMADLAVDIAGGPVSPAIRNTHP